MNNTLITVMDTEGGFYKEFRGARYSSRALQPESLVEDHEQDNERKMLRTIQTWACREEDVPVLIEHISKEWVGYEIKIFNLIGAATRVAGEVTQKQVSKDGILPV